MDFRILGPLEVTVGGCSVVLCGPKPRAMVLSLLLAAGREDSVDRLVADVWGEHPPPSAVNALQTSVSRLRQVLGTGTVQRHQAGYALATDPERVDARRFERLLADGRTALAAGDARQGHRAIDEALALWRGPALLDVADEQFAQADIGRFTELQGSAC